MRKGILLFVVSLLSGCVSYKWVNNDPGKNNQGYFDIDKGECMAYAYQAIPEPNINKPTPPPQTTYYGSLGGSKQKTTYDLQTNTGQRITGTATTTTEPNMYQQFSDDMARQNAYQQQLRSYNQAQNRSKKIRNTVYQGCMTKRGWQRVKVDNN